MEDPEKTTATSHWQTLSHNVVHLAWAIEKGNHSFSIFNDTTSPTGASNGLCHILGEYRGPTMSRISWQPNNT